MGFSRRSESTRRRPRSLYALEQLEQRLALTAQLLTDFNSADLGFKAEHFTEFNGEFYFTANSREVVNAELWKTDGTNEGTRLVSEIELESGYPGAISDIAVADDRLVFLIEYLPDFGGRFYHLFASDGTKEGTTSVLDFDDRWPTDHMRVGEMVTADDRIYLATSFEHHSSFVLTTDGTLAGTYPASDSRHSLAVDVVVPFGDALFLTSATYRFPDGSGSSGRADYSELWFVDATKNSDRVVKDIYPGKRGSMPEELVVVQDALYFTAEQFDGRELWASDSTAAGTNQVMDIRPGPTSSHPTELTAHAGELFFVADDGAHGMQLWHAKSPENANRLTSFSDGRVPNQLASLGDNVFFVAASEDGAELWKTDGTAGGETLVGPLVGTNASVEAGTKGLLITTASETGALQVTYADDTSFISLGAIDADALSLVGEIDEFLFFSTRDENGETLWRTDGTINGTASLGPIGHEPGPFEVVDGRLVFSATRRDAPELLSTDGTEIQTLKDKFRTNGSTTVHYARGVDGKAVITIEPRIDNLHQDYSDWITDTLVSDGRSAHLLADKQFRWVSGSEGPYFVDVDSEYFFFALSQVTVPEPKWVGQLWTTDLTPDGTRQVDPSELPEGHLLASFDPTSDYDLPGRGIRTDIVAPQVILNGFFHQFAVTSHGSYTFRRRSRELHRLTGVDRSERVALLPSNISGFRLDVPAGYGFFRGTWEESIVAFADHLFFAVSDTTSGWEIWRSDGTQEGTQLVQDILPGPESSQPTYLGKSTDRIFFRATDDKHGREIWALSIDEEPIVFDLRTGPVGSTTEPHYPQQKLEVVVGDVPYVEADDGTHGREIWAIKPDNSFEVIDIRPGPESSAIDFFGEVNGKVYFAADDGVHGLELWVIDANGVSLLKDIRPGSLSSHPHVLVELRDSLLFTADDGVHGREIWSVVDDVPPLPGDTDGNGLVGFDDFLMLAANFGTVTVEGSRAGDFDESGDVDFLDFLFLSHNFGKQV